jgi:hypothetical protein
MLFGKNTDCLIFAPLIQNGVNPLVHARVAKLVDALCSGRSVGNHVLVRIQSRAQCLSNEV